jgi:hypothetical protein
MNNVVRLKGRRAGKHLTRDEISAVVSDVPLPQLVREVRRKYPFPEMAVGDSFSFPSDRLDSMRVSLSRFRRTHPGHTFVWQVEGDRVRVWRTA